MPKPADMVRCFLTVAWLLSAVLSARAQNADAILGQWLTGTGKAHIEIYRQHGLYQGRIVWLRAPFNEEGRPKLDVHNPSVALQSRPLIGMVNLTGFRYDKAEGVYTHGMIYDPESGKTYRCMMSVRPDGTLSVRGYIGFTWIGRTEVWQRVRGK